MNWDEWDKGVGSAAPMPTAGGGDGWDAWDARNEPAPMPYFDAPVTGVPALEVPLRALKTTAEGHIGPALDAPTGAPADAPYLPSVPEPPQGSDTPLSDAYEQAKTYGGLGGPAISAVLGALGGEMNRALGGAWNKTRGDEAGAINPSTLLSGIPLLGLQQKYAEAFVPGYREASQTPLRDVPGLGTAVRAGEAIGGALNAGYETIGKPAMTTLAMMREQNRATSEKINFAPANALRTVTDWTTGWLNRGNANPELLDKAGMTKEEANGLLNGWLFSRNTPEQNRRFEKLLHDIAPSEMEHNPVSSAVLSSAFDPLTYADAGGLLPKLSAVQEARRVYGAAGDVTAAGKVLREGGNPFENLLYKAFQPKSVGTGELLSEKAAQIVGKQDTTVLARAFRAFKKTPIAQTIDNVKRAVGNVGPFLTDSGRTLDEKIKFLHLMADVTNTKKISPELQAAAKQFGVPNSPDYHTLLHSIGKFDSKPVRDGYVRANQILDSLGQTAGTRRGAVYSSEVAEFARGQAQGTPYESVFDRLIEGWRRGELDMKEAKRGLESVAGLQLTADVTEHLAVNLAQKAGIETPNFATNLVNRMKNLEGALYVGGNPASLLNNSLNDMFTGFRHGTNFQSDAQLDEFFKRFGQPYDDTIGTTTKRAVDAKRKVTGNLEGAQSAYGTTTPGWFNKLPGVKQMQAAFEKNQLWHRRVANATGQMRYVARNHDPKLSPALKQFFGSKAATMEGELKHALNIEEALKVIRDGRPTWARFTRELADELTNLLTPIAAREMKIAPEMMHDALPLAFTENLNRALSEAAEAAARGEDVGAAFKQARGKYWGDDLFGDAGTVQPSSPPSTPPGGGGAAKDVDSFWNRVPAQELNRMSAADRTFRINNGRQATVSELEAMLAGKNPAPEVPLTQPKPAQAPQPQAAPQGVPMVITKDMERRLGALGYADAEISAMPPQEAQDILREGRKAQPVEPTGRVTVTDTAADVAREPTGETPTPVQAAPVSNVIEQVKQRAAQLTAPTIRRDLIREWAALFHEGAPENEMRAISRSIDKWSDDVLLEKAQSYVTRARESGQTWLNTMADMFEDRAHYVLDQIAAGNPKYNTPEMLERVANGDALTKLLRGGENGFDWTKFEQPFDGRGYESFAQYRKRVTDEAIERDFIRPTTGDSGVVAESAGTGSAASAGGQVGGVGGGDDVGATVPPLSEGRMTLDAGEPQPLDDLARINAERFRASAQRMRDAGAAGFTDPALNRQTMNALEQALLDRIEREITQNGISVNDALPPQIDAEINRYLKEEYLPNLNGIKAGANAAGRFFQDATVLNYDGQWNVETAMLLERPFVHWWLHSALNYSRDFLDHPAMLAFMLRLSNNINAESNRLVDEGKLPERFRNRTKVSLPFEIPGMGDTLWVNPLRMAFPFEDVLQLNAQERAGYGSVKADGSVDPSSIINDTFGVHTPVKLAMNALMQDDEEFMHSLATIPALRLLRAGTGIGLPSKYDAAYYERAIKELVADGTLTQAQANVALLQQSGKDWDTVKRRANMENYTMREGSALLGLRGMVFTPGEQKYYESKLAKEQALQDAVRNLGGNPNMDSNQRYEFLKRKGYYASPEYEALKAQYPELDTLANIAYDDNGERMPMDEAQEARAREYYLDKIGEAYWNAPALKQKLIAADLGDEFKTLFRNKDTRNLDAIPMKTVLGWANALDQYLQAPVAGANLPPPDPYRITFPTDAQNKAYGEFQDALDTVYGDARAAESAYWKLPEAQRGAFVKANPRLKQLWDFRREFYAEHSDIEKLLEDAGVLERKASTTPTVAADPRGAALNQAVVAVFGGWDDVEQWKDDYERTGKKTDGLIRYWELVRAIYGNKDKAQSQNTRSGGYGRRPSLYRDRVNTRVYNNTRLPYFESAALFQVLARTRQGVSGRRGWQGQARPPQPPRVPYQSGTRIG